MSWAHNITMASNWQLRHELAFWKAKAISLDYENKILHGIIRNNHVTPAIPGSQSSSCGSESEAEETSGEEDSPDGEELLDDNAKNNIEVSEEFIEFIRANAKYKEDARRERERLKAETLPEENSVEQLEAGPSEEREDEQARLKELYGDEWQRIAALEMSLQSDFISKCDKEKPVYWPNIPLNL